jgi:hypothetical protein
MADSLSRDPTCGYLPEKTISHGSSQRVNSVSKQAKRHGLDPSFLFQYSKRSCKTNVDGTLIEKPTKRSSEARTLPSHDVRHKWNMKFMRDLYFSTFSAVKMTLGPASSIFSSFRSLSSIVSFSMSLSWRSLLVCGWIFNKDKEV